MKRIGQSSSFPLGVAVKNTSSATASVWAPFVQSLSFINLSRSGEETPLQKNRFGQYEGIIKKAKPGNLYYFRLNNQTNRPDPASRHQPDGVHGPSEIVDSHFPWQDRPWKGFGLNEAVFYELHIGAFTKEGTFESAIPRLPHLKKMGVTAIEIMPVSQFPGARNWGYDGVYPFAPQNTYGGPQGLKKLINACHKIGLGFVLDVVYNHQGPEGNYLNDFGPYFTNRYKTPWGKAINFDGEGSPGVRRFVLENARQWFYEYHVDALRLDAIHAIFDNSPRHILRDLQLMCEKAEKKLSKKLYLIPESDLNDSRVIRPIRTKGHGLPAQWSDDYHHAVHALLTKEKTGYYVDFGSITHLKKALDEGYVYTGQHSPFRKKKHGTKSRDLPPSKFIVFSQNHDQIGNRMMGERLTHLLTFDQLKLAAGAVLLSPTLPLLFMGEEYGETAPFLYFVSHGDSHLIEAVRQGRKKEFESFGWKKEPPDPQRKSTFLKSKLRWNLINKDSHKSLLAFYRELLRIRKRENWMGTLERKSVSTFVVPKSSTIVVTMKKNRKSLAWAGNFGDRPVVVPSQKLLFAPRVIIDSAQFPEKRTGGAGAKMIESPALDGLKLAPYQFIAFVSKGEMNG